MSTTRTLLESALVTLSLGAGYGLGALRPGPPLSPLSTSERAAPARSAPARPRLRELDDGGSRETLPGGARRALSAREMIAEAATTLKPTGVAAAVRLELELGRPEQALELLRRNPRADAETYLEAALSLKSAGESAAASELFCQALRRDLDDVYLLESFVEHDPAACLVELDRLAREDWVEEPELERLDFCRAAALHALGRSRAAVAMLPALSTYYVRGAGCVPSHVKGRDWELAAWAEVAPREVQALLSRVFEESASAEPGELAILAGTCVRLGNLALLERVLADLEETGHVDAEAKLALAPYLGWSTIRSAWEQEPSDERLARALAEREQQAGRHGAALEIWGRFLEQTWADGEEVDDLPEILRSAPPEVEALVLARVRELQSGLHEPYDAAWELGQLAEDFWQLGRYERARELWRAAGRVDPEQRALWMAARREAELGLR
jgi:tetratricopeptide (TPR) repeat protein